MQDPVRVLKKILAANCPAEPFVETGEPLEQAIALLRQTQKMRQARQWIRDHAGFDIVPSPETFHQLLDIREIDTLEAHTRDLEVRVESQKNERAPGDPVGVGNLNALLRELHRDVQALAALQEQEFAQVPPLLARGITAESACGLQIWLGTLRELNWRGWNYIVAVLRALAVEREFRRAFPQPENAHPLRNTWPSLEREAEFYRRCLDLENRWRVLGLDVFRLVRDKSVGQLARTLEELGNGLWTLVYHRSTVSGCLELAGIDFADIRSVFDNPKILLA
jgi:hypothetical protein